MPSLAGRCPLLLTIVLCIFSQPTNKGCLLDIVLHVPILSPQPNPTPLLTIVLAYLSAYHKGSPLTLFFMFPFSPAPHPPSIPQPSPTKRKRPCCLAIVLVLCNSFFQISSPSFLILPPYPKPLATPFPRPRRSLSVHMFQHTHKLLPPLPPSATDKHPKNKNISKEWNPVLLYTHCIVWYIYIYIVYFLFTPIIYF